TLLNEGVMGSRALPGFMTDWSMPGFMLPPGWGWDAGGMQAMLDNADAIAGYVVGGGSLDNDMMREFSDASNDRLLSVGDGSGATDFTNDGFMAGRVMVRGFNYDGMGG